MKSFWLELVSTCKTFRFVAIIVILIAFQAMLFNQFEGQSPRTAVSLQTSINSYRTEMRNWLFFWEQQKENPRYGLPQALIEENFAWYVYESALANDIHVSYYDGDWSTFNRAMAERYLMEWNLHVYQEQRRQRHPSLDNLPTQEVYFGDSWPHFDKMVDVFPVTIMPWMSQERSFEEPEVSLFTAVYHLHLLDAGLPPTSPHDTTPWAFFFNFLRMGLPTLLGAVAMLMTVNLLHRDKKTGVIKYILQQPKHRASYLWRKVCVGFASSMGVILLPTSMMFIYLGLKKGFTGYNLPVLIDRGFFRWSVMPDPVSYRLKDYVSTLYFGLSQYQLTLPNNYGTLERVQIIPLWQFLIIALIFIAVMVLFYSVLALLVSTLIKNELFAQVTAIGFLVVGSSFSYWYPQLKNTPWDLFSKVNIVPLMEGNHYSTYLSGLATLGIAIALLFALTTFVFKGQDVHSE